MKKIFKRVLAALRGEPAPIDIGGLTDEEHKVAGEFIDAAMGIPPRRRGPILSGAKHVATTRDGKKVMVVEDMDAPKVQEPPKPLGTKCGLPGCTVLTLHNGGYCCADHCREHRQRLRQQKSA